MKIFEVRAKQSGNKKGNGQCGVIYCPKELIGKRVLLKKLTIQEEKQITMQNLAEEIRRRIPKRRQVYKV